jgi:aldehyde dehydrogenase (NAD+)
VRLAYNCTGKVIARVAAENLTPILLELGGQNPALGDETAELKLWFEY